MVVAPVIITQVVLGRLLPDQCVCKAGCQTVTKVGASLPWLLLLLLLEVIGLC
jgi:hypothetical protein